MSERVYKSIREPIRGKISWEESWEGPDKGQITCWEVGRKLSEREPELTVRAKRGELPPLGWKGGVARRTKTKTKNGPLFYLAEWQGLRGDDLDIDLSEEKQIICAKTGMKVTYTANTERFKNS